MARGALAAIAAALLVVLAGCGEVIDPGAPGGDAATVESASPDPAADPPGDGSAAETTVVYDSLAPGTVVRPGPTDPAEMDRLDHEDVVGWEAGYWHNDSIDVDLHDGLSEAEAGPYLARAMARVEYLRGVEFTREVTMVVSTEAEILAIQEQYDQETARNDATLRERLDVHRAQMMEALFVIGADEAPSESDYGFVINGIYNWGDDRIRVVQYDGDHPWAHPSGVHPHTFRETLVVHELVHALQDEFGSQAVAIRSSSNADGYDAYAAAAGLLEGEATYVEILYAERCESGAWECVVEPPFPSDPRLDEVATDRRLAEAFVSWYYYNDGVAFVDYLYTEGVVGRTGWDAIDYAHQAPPRSTEQITHPDSFPSDFPRFVYVPRGTNGWTNTYNNVLGERYLYTMFWFQDREHGIPVVDSDAFYDETDEDASLAEWGVYESTPSVGWAGDRFLDFQRGDEHAYSWTVQFDTVEDAAEFHAAYLQVLAGHGGEQVGEYTWVIPDGQFADAFYVEHRGTQVIIVNAPAVDDLGDVNPSIAHLIDTGG